MEAAVECTHCKVLMTSWSAPGSPIRYWQCPFCARTHSSLYREVFRRRAGARVLDAPAAAQAPASPADIPMASQDDIRWTRVRSSAARWFARLESEERPAPIKLRVRAAIQARAEEAAGERPAANTPEDLPEIDPADVIEVAAASSGARRRR